MTLQVLTFNNTVGVMGELTIQDCDDLTTLNFPELLVVGGDVTISNVPTCATLTMPSLAVVAGNFAVSSASISSFELPALTRVGGNFAPSDMASLTTISLPVIRTIVGSISCNSGTDALTTFTLAEGLQSVGGNVSFTSCALNQESVDGLLVSLAALDGTSGTTLYTDTVTITGTSVGPSLTGATAVATLQGRGATVVTNSGVTILTAAIAETGSASTTVNASSGHTAAIAETGSLASTVNAGAGWTTAIAESGTLASTVNASAGWATAIAETSTLASTVDASVGQSGFPGQVDNPVGHAAAPGFTSLTPSSITPVSGTSGSPQVYNFLDFDSGTGGVLLQSGQDWITFNGCRFQSNAVGNYNVRINGATNITFNFCSFTPRVALAGASPPGGQWPSAGVNVFFQENGVNSTDGAQGYQYGLNIEVGGPITCNSCDFWGFGNGGPLFYTTTADMLIDNCWIHDPCYAGSFVTQAVASTSASTTIAIPTGGISAGFTVEPFQFANTTTSSSGSTTLTLDSTGDIGVGWIVNGSGISGSPTVVSITDGTHLVMSSAQTISNGVQITFSFAGSPTVVSITDATHLVISAAVSVPNGASVAFSLIGGQGYHVDGTGYLNGAVPSNNVTIQNCTIAGLFNTNALAWQGGSAAFDNINHIGNYLSGGGYCCYMGDASGPGVFTNSRFENNTFGTEIPWIFGPFRSDYTAVWKTVSGNGNTWSGNVIAIAPGSVQSPQTFPLTWDTGQDGQFIYPDSSLNVSDFPP